MGGTLSNDAQSGIGNSGSLDNAAGATINNAGLFFTGTCPQPGQCSTGSWSNEGTINNAGDMRNSGCDATHCTSTLFTNSGTVNNTGTFTNFGSNGTGGTIISSGTINNNVGGSFANLAGATLYNSGTFTNDGMLSNGGTLTDSGLLTNSGTLNSSGILTVEKGGTLNNTATGAVTAASAGIAGTLTNNGTFTMAGGGTLDVLTGGTLDGSGTIFGNISNAGTLAPGNSPGVLNIKGDYTQMVAGTFLAELAGAVPGLYDQVNIGGNAFLAGTLDVELDPGFVVQIGESFILMTYGAEKGQFSLVDLPTLAAGEQWLLSYNQTTLTLTVEQGTTQTPEPASLLLAMAGIGGVFLRRAARRLQT